MKPLNYLAVVGLAYSVVISTGCGGNDCGTGTTETDGECLGTLQCGEGTQVANGACVPSNPDGLTCGGNTQLSEDGTECVLSEGACAAPATLDTATGQCVAPGDLQCGSGTVERDGFCIPSCDGPFETQNSTRTGCVTAARIQLVHASPDPELSTVDVYSGPNLLESPDGTEIGDDFSYGDASPVLKVALSAGLRIIASNGQSEDDPLVELSGGDLGANRFLVVIQGGVRSRPREIAVFTEFREEAANQDTVIATLVHSSPDAPAISAGFQEQYATASTSELFSNTAYQLGGASLTYAGLELDSQVIDIYPNGGGEPVASVQTSSGDVFPVPSGLPNGESVAFVATGLLNPEDGEPNLEILAVTTDGASGFLDRAARLQVVHAAAAAPTPVDVYLGEMGATSAAAGTEVVEDLAYQNATPFRSYVAGVPGMLQVTEANQATLAVNEPFTPMMGQIARLVAIGGADGQELTVSVVDGAEVSADGAGNIDLQMFHASTSAPASVDVYFTVSEPGAPPISFGDPDVGGLAFGMGGAPVTQPFRDYLVSVADAGATEELVRFTAAISTSLFTGSDGEALFAAITGSASPSVTGLDLLLVSPAGVPRDVGGAEP
ncbi:MAG: DUF4397 domain-containing protein [Myxococcota bacterium]